MKKKGFTLIELLAVIVILAIIAIIATPIVLNIIRDSKESAQIQSAEFYLDAVEYSIANSILNNNDMIDGVYNVLANGNLCLKFDENKKCINEKNVELDGEKPIGGYVYINGGKIKESRISYEENSIRYLEDGNIFISDYEISDEIVFNPGDGNKTWNVIDETKGTLTLMLTENLENILKWHSTRDNNNGPIDALNSLNSITKDWDNVDPIVSYSYVNNLNGNEKPNGYQKIEITNGVTTLTHKDGSITTLTELSKARLLTVEEVFQIASKTNRNLEKENLIKYIKRNLSSINTSLGISATKVDEVVANFIKQDNYVWLKNESEYVKLYFTVLVMITSENIDITYDILLPSYLYQNLNEVEGPYGYWTLSPRPNLSTNAWSVNSTGRVYGFYVDDNVGVRPVITIVKDKLK